MYKYRLLTCQNRDITAFWAWGWEEVGKGARSSPSAVRSDQIMHTVPAVYRDKGVNTRNSNGTSCRWLLLRSGEWEHHGKRDL